MPHIERADSFGAIYLVRGEAHQVDIECTDVDRDFANRLGGIAV